MSDDRAILALQKRQTVALEKLELDVAAIQKTMALFLQHAIGADLAALEAELADLSDALQTDRINLAASIEAANLDEEKT